jgi:molybdopterin-binding protein
MLFTDYGAKSVKTIRIHLAHGSEIYAVIKASDVIVATD